MFISILLGVLIFSYAIFTIYRFIKRSKMGKCAGCELSKNCAGSCSTSPIKEKNPIN
ncbi:FeoB-associated Cys-rich membrane protein [Lederbergia wuyishanensis]|uniref:Radical SAM protein with 4Fe4S-binding SPASM domain n=2 Tax=Lederbergia wuyishanensis TaxID=1347903 RepID=A0ABU0D855_9BACI|nr:FeoB-associated Cys-rich membrane protein [Lederbergia wuyishanensis]MCJ8009316.1 FeoB-associated Cys-rich membrane protein [Lederbergia wuyishanensis]MDQ0344550.1 radical SAM protein with 4Fe4S-binding SPASM domain [Lederbergia wuyishanensis]